MKQTIRYNTFETNSSSYHTLTLKDSEQIKDFIDDIKVDLRNMEDEDDLQRIIEDVRKLETYLVEDLNKKNYYVDYDL